MLLSSYYISVITLCDSSNIFNPLIQDQFMRGCVRWSLTHRTRETLEAFSPARNAARIVWGLDAAQIGMTPRVFA